MRILNTLLLLPAIVFVGCAAHDAGLTRGGLHAESGGVVVMEAEQTASELGAWERRTDVDGYLGEGYLEFTGNTPMSGPPDSPLEYRFHISKPGLYLLHLRCARERVDERDDLANDAYVRVEGNFGPGPNPGDAHGRDAPLDMLKQDTKFFGGDHRRFVWAGGNRLDPGGHQNKRIAVYEFRAGEDYRLVMSGRSQRFKVDRLVFRHADVSPEAALALTRPVSDRVAE